MKSANYGIGVVTMGSIPEIVLNVICVHLSEYFRVPTKIFPSMEKPSYAYDERRMQYDAGTILQAMETMPFNGVRKVMAVCDVDIFIPIVTHVFGQARQGGKYGLVSLYRLRENSAEEEVSSKTLERAVKVALHEMGHLFSLEHCDDPGCLMHFSPTLAQLEKTTLGYCRYCKI